jgi:hypothetical protein
MIETVQATADTHHPDDAYLWVKANATAPNVWRRFGGGMLLHADASTGLSELKVRQAQYGPNKGRLQVVWTANLPALLYGKAAKVGTLPGSQLERALTAAVAEASRHLPGLAPHMLSSWMPSRVDASATWWLQGVDHAVCWEHLESAARALDGAFRGRGKYAQPGTRSIRIHRTAEDLLRIYDKTTEALDTGQPLPTGLSPARGRLLRVEAQHVKRKARLVYGKTLADVATDGVRMARNVLQDWLDDLGAAATAKGPREVLTRLINGGMPAPRALALLGPALLLRSGGIDALMNEGGLSRRQSNALAVEIRRAVSDDAWSEILGVPLDLDDLLFADDDVLSATG